MIKAKICYFNQKLSFSLEQSYSISGDDNNIFDSNQAIKGMKNAIKWYDQKIRQVLKTKKFKCSQQDAIDAELVKAYNENQKKGLYVVNSISFAIQAIKSRIFCKPLYKLYSQLAEKPLKAENTSAIFVNCLHGGKVIGSKCKVFKYYLISSSKQAFPLIQSILQSIRKAITSGKGGEAALKYSPDGTFICPLDTILDNLKIVEDSINNTPGAKQHFKIGLSWQADTLFGVDTKKYQLENPKTPFDNDQMIDYLVKMLTDKPIIGYLEDPLASSQIASWSKLKKKIQQTQTIKHVKIGTRNGTLLNISSQSFSQRLQQLSIPLTPDSNPQLSAPQLQAKNSVKFCLSYFQIRLFELQTVTNLVKFYKQLQKTNTTLILQDNQYQSYNSQLIDIGVGLGCAANLGSIVKYIERWRSRDRERMKQNNEEIVEGAEKYKYLISGRQAKGYKSIKFREQKSDIFHNNINARKSL